MRYVRNIMLPLTKWKADKDHIHYMIETEPNINLSDLVKPIKSYTTYHIWKQHGKYLSKHFGKEKCFGQADILFVVLEMLAKNN